MPLTSSTAAGGEFSISIPPKKATPAGDSPKSLAERMVKGAAAMVPSLGRSKDLESLRTPLLSAGSERSETSRSSPGGSPDAKTEKQIAKMRTAMADLVYPGRKTPEELSLIHI